MRRACSASKTPERRIETKCRSRECMGDTKRGTETEMTERNKAESAGDGDKVKEGQRQRGDNTRK